MKSAAPKKKSKRLSVKSLRDHPLYRLETALIAFALVAGVGSAALSEINRKAANEALLANYQLKTVLVASKALSPGTILDQASMRQTQVLQGSTTENYVEPDDVDNILGRRLGVELREGDPLLLTAVEGAGLNETVASRIPAGKRLVTLQVADAVAANGWVTPNDHVDVLAHMDLPGRGATTVTLLEDVVLVSVGKATVWQDGQSSAGAEIGFFVTPREVEFLSFAQQQGTFSLALRNPADVYKRSMDLNDLGEAGVDMDKFHDHHSLKPATGGGDLDVRVNGQKKGK